VVSFFAAFEPPAASRPPDVIGMACVAGLMATIVAISRPRWPVRGQPPLSLR